MGEILFIAHRIPFPPDRGDKIRSHHVLRALARLAPVHVATFADDEQDHRFEADLAALAESYCLVHRSKALPVAGMEALATGKPLSLAAFHDRRLERYVRDVIARRPIDVIYIFSGQMAQYVPTGFRGRVVADLVDVDSAKFEAYAQKSSGLRAWMERREGRLLCAEEARIARTCNVTLLISKAEAGLLQSRLEDRNGASVRVCSMGNGMDSDHFDPAYVKSEPRMLAKGSPRLIFTGQMDYAPNIEAALRAVDRIMPRVRAACPNASLHIVGRNPSAALKARGGRDGVEVWGRVEDIRPWLAAADMALVPLEIARGVQNKVLEAMAMKLPVVLSPEAATGIDACDGRDFLVAATDAQLADAIVALASDPARASDMGTAAREWIVASASWEAAVAQLPAYLGLEKGSVSDAA
ncbi:TIGR03087 family PEP-CTERM/XrtA system glycosyltransferase [Novosphingobium mangrovi (ex Huang et al. 2023)]|uniref:TIGR03087 family PEP-CTERM/XrtA system glycosyltransferase n=1 Tax=Novosphingobium mangrovi (ex Huang et al. 2023) TaxID=2976432 RepID=A0ABT2I597_9SPHN|nr:TIGR03087 family PEP-CTERM/XrtA system glycosyltransferase [Novosphingobium mangrovi (ex Huang et al. 2023)]MCT2399983.1 TIGR03087 family PEP-CTERM/XrtA system glycosyltransferase [Novosphingobium mangrovi (ex Huang et al. 2023)]